jgi:vancomycin resistance protein YoaR
MKKRKAKNLLLLVFLGFIVFASIIIFVGLNLVLTHQNRFFPQTKISNIDVGGKTKAEAVKILEEKNQKYLNNESIALNFAGLTQNLAPSEISATINAPATVDYVFEETHPNFFRSIFKSFESMISGSNWSQEVAVDKEKLNTILDGLTKDNYTAPKDASLEIADDSIVFSEAKYGEGPDLTSAQEVIKDNLSHLKNSTIEIRKIKLEPAISDIDLAQAYFKTSWLLQNKGFNLKKGSMVIYSINSRDLKNWLKFEKKTYANFEDTGMFKGKVAGVSISVKDEAGVFALPQLIRNKNVLEAYIDTTKVNDFVSLLASRIDEKPEDAKLVVVNNAVTVAQKENYGRALDQKKLLEEINLRLNSSSEKDIQLPVTSLIPDVRSDNISELGIKEKIAEGISSFAGSPKNRINNLTIGTSKFNGAIIKPDEIASFADIVGEVDESQGYLPELVIKGTETIQELGGGMCQVSTTFYRVALNAGVPIVERHPHAYLVGYYKDGPDATVYVPSTDLKWKNDTGHYILVQTSVDPAKKKVTFSLWGTNDGRQVTVSAPTYTDIVPAPTDPYYVDDPTYPTGYLVEEEHPHEGATGTITRTITYPGGKTKTDTIKSTYKPWPAKMRRGTGPADLPIPPKE